MDILINTLGILVIYIFLLSLFGLEEIGILFSLAGLLLFTAYVWNTYDFAIAIVVR